jgi:hypothetical protein
MASAVEVERLVSVAQAARQAGHGQRAALYQAAARDLGISVQTLHRRLRDLSIHRRKRRCDAGETALSLEEAQLISGVLTESTRANGKRLYGVGDALRALRANGMVRAERINPATGEVTLLSDSAVLRGLSAYGLHPEQQRADAPCSELASRHPNHVWQIDASLCVLYYLRPEGGGLQPTDPSRHYKNKPGHLASIAAQRVWSYEITDHASGWIYVEYVLGAESGENLCNVLINAMQARGNGDAMHGVPRILFMDPGSANTSAMALNLCKSLGIEAIAHAPGSARATGQVENARNIIERRFEAGLKFRPVADLAELNALATAWRIQFNREQIHRRHKMTRTDCWMRITAEQLVTAPPAEVCRELAVAAPVPRKVCSKLRVSFGGEQFDVSRVPDVMVGQKLMLTRSPARDDAAQVVRFDAEGHEVFHVVPRVERDDYGFALDAAEIGASYKRPADTRAQKARAEVEQLMTGTRSAEAAAAARKRKTIPLGGEFNPYKEQEEATLPTYLPRRGTAHGLTAPIVELPPLSHVAAAKLLRARLGERWTAETMARLKAEFPDGVPEAALDDFLLRLTAPRAPALRLVGGEM